MDSLTGSLAPITPLTLEEKQHPIAFAPMLDPTFPGQGRGSDGAGNRARAGVAGETWGLPPRPGRPFQQITTFYLHRGTGGTATAWPRSSSARLGSVRTTCPTTTATVFRNLRSASPRTFFGAGARVLTAGLSDPNPFDQRGPHLGQRTGFVLVPLAQHGYSCRWARPRRGNG